MRWLLFYQYGGFCRLISCLSGSTLLPHRVSANPLFFSVSTAIPPQRDFGKEKFGIVHRLPFLLLGSGVGVGGGTGRRPWAQNSRGKNLVQNLKWEKKKYEVVYSIINHKIVRQRSSTKKSLGLSTFSECIILLHCDGCAVDFLLVKTFRGKFEKLEGKFEKLEAQPPAFALGAGNPRCAAVTRHQKRLWRLNFRTKRIPTEIKFLPKRKLKLWAAGGGGGEYGHFAFFYNRIDRGIQVIQWRGNVHDPLNDK